MDQRRHSGRAEAAYRRLGTRTPRCGNCGENRWQCLEAHHVAGQAYDPTTVILCRNCHRMQSNAQRDHPPKQASADEWLELVGRFLLGVADLLAVLVEKFREFGAELIARAAAPPPVANPMQGS